MNIAAGTQLNQVSIIDSLVQAQRERLDRIFDITVKMRDKFCASLKPQMEGKPTEEQKLPVLDESPLAETLRRLNRQCDNIIEGLESIINRCEL